jgi:uncharacterized protein
MWFITTTEYSPARDTYVIIKTAHCGIKKARKGFLLLMETLFIESETLSQIQKEVQRRFTGIDDLAHGWEHIIRVYNLALHIAEQEGADRFVVGMAALMHDLGKTAPHEEANGNTHHADLSVTLATELLQTYRVPADKQQAILHAIVAHSFSKGGEPQTLEAAVVRDADRLDGLGAIGILRWAATGIHRRTSETLPYHPEDPFGEKRNLDDRRYMLDHFYSKLLKLGETMTTKTGRLLARRRTAFMHTYLYEFKRELEV